MPAARRPRRAAAAAGTPPGRAGEKTGTTPGLETRYPRHPRHREGQESRQNKTNRTDGRGGGRVNVNEAQNETHASEMNERCLPSCLPACLKLHSCSAN